VCIPTFWSEVYNVFGSLFYDLVGYYELQFNRDPTYIIKYENVQPSMEVLPIYGKSYLPKYAFYLCQLPVIKRLTEIRQLAHTYVLYPGATHTRYEHSRGVMHKGRILLDKINSELSSKEVKFNDDDKILLDVAALLHDLGHPAWGHALDGITGYVVQLLRETNLFFFSPKKLDITITIYLLMENTQLSKALKICAKEIKNSKVRELFDQIIAQIIMEEEFPFSEMLDQDILKRIHLLTTILGGYGGKKKEWRINADRLDWLIRDTHHANLIDKLPSDLKSKYCEFYERNKNNNFKIDVINQEYLGIADASFNKLMDDLRETIYSAIYEGKERSFVDSMLIRLAYSAISILNKVGLEIASAPTTIRAIMGYLLMPDFLMKQYTHKTLHLAKQHIQLLGLADPLATFITKSYNLSLISDAYIGCIMHYLSNTSLKHIYLPMFQSYVGYIEIEQIDKNLIIFPAKAFGALIEAAQNASKADEICKLAVLFQDILTASRLNVIGALKIPTIESVLQEEFKDFEIYLLANYYFFRKLDDCFRDEITDFARLRNVLAEKLESVPILFIIMDKVENVEELKKISESLSLQILNNLIALFKSIEPFE